MNSFKKAIVQKALKSFPDGRRKDNFDYLYKDVVACVAGLSIAQALSTGMLPEKYSE